MNKYQEAFRLFGKSIEKTMDNFTMDELIELKEADKVLAELIDRATPKQPLNRYTYNTDGGEKVENGECPHCHKAMVRTMDIESSFCDHCGQSLEWEGEKK